MSRYCRRQIWMVRVSHDNMPSAFDDVKAIGSIQTSKVILSPAKGGLTHASEQCMFSCHKGKLSTEQQTDAIPMPNSTTSRPTRRSLRKHASTEKDRLYQIRFST